MTNKNYSNKFKIIFKQGSTRELFPWEKNKTIKGLNELSPLEQKMYDLIMSNKDTIKHPESINNFRNSRNQDIIFSNSVGDYIFGIYGFNHFNEKENKIITSFATRYDCSCPCSDEVILEVHWEQEINKNDFSVNQNNYFDYYDFFKGADSLEWMDEDEIAERDNIEDGY